MGSLLALLVLAQAASAAGTQSPEPPSRSSARSRTSRHARRPASPSRTCAVTAAELTAYLNLLTEAAAEPDQRRRAVRARADRSAAACSTWTRSRSSKAPRARAASSAAACSVFLKGRLESEDGFGTVRGRGGPARLDPAVAERARPDRGVGDAQPGAPPGLRHPGAVPLPVRDPHREAVHRARGPGVLTPAREPVRVRHPRLHSPGRAMFDLAAPIQYVKGVGPQRAAALAKRGVASVEDLLLHVPLRYEDRAPLRADRRAAARDARVGGRRRSRSRGCGARAA